MADCYSIKIIFIAFVLIINKGRLRTQNMKCELILPFPCTESCNNLHELSEWNALDGFTLAFAHTFDLFVWLKPLSWLHCAHMDYQFNFQWATFQICLEII